MISNRRTKIVATIGPATSSKKCIQSLLISGVNSFRLNFSHGTHFEHQKVIENIRSLSILHGAPTTIICDLQGPKIRTGKTANGKTELKQGQIVRLSSMFKIGDSNNIPSDFPNINLHCKIGDRILLDDGIIELKVVKKQNKILHCKVIFGGILTDNKGINLPNSKSIKSKHSTKDLKDLKFALKNKVDYIALSFVKDLNDILKLKKIISNSNSPETRVIAKIERLEAVNNIEEIAIHSDAIMVARGDLSVEIGQTGLPFMQKKIINKCNFLGKPVITATQMLESMIEKPKPTRAEITDIANAVLDGTDAVMLSAETAIGKYPDKCVKTMHEIILEVEKTIFENYSYADHKIDTSNMSQSIAQGACVISQMIKAKLIVSLTNTGKTSRLISAYRPKSKILAATNLKYTLNKLELMWGVQTFFLKPYKTAEEAISSIKNFIIKNSIVKPGDHIVITLGFPLLKTGSTNCIQVHEIKKSKKLLSKNKRPLRYR